MAEIPSDIPSSAAQAGFQAREVAKDRDARRAGQANAVERQVKAAGEADTTVETADNDTQICADAEGTGSQGRNFQEESPEQEDAPDKTADGGITKDAEGRLHLDLEA